MGCYFFPSLPLAFVGCARRHVRWVRSSSGQFVPWKKLRGAGGLGGRGCLRGLFPFLAFCWLCELVPEDCCWLFVCLCACYVVGICFSVVPSALFLAALTVVAMLVLPMLSAPLLVRLCSTLLFLSSRCLCLARARSRPGPLLALGWLAADERVCKAPRFELCIKSRASWRGSVAPRLVGVSKRAFTRGGKKHRLACDASAAGSNRTLLW